MACRLGCCGFELGVFWEVVVLRPMVLGSSVFGASASRDPVLRAVALLAVVYAFECCGLGGCGSSGCGFGGCGLCGYGLVGCGVGYTKLWRERTCLSHRAIHPAPCVTTFLSRAPLKAEAC